MTKVVTFCHFIKIINFFQFLLYLSAVGIISVLLQWVILNHWALELNNQPAKYRVKYYKTDNYITKAWLLAAVLTHPPSLLREKKSKIHESGRNWPYNIKLEQQSYNTDVFNILATCNNFKTIKFIQLWKVNVIDVQCVSVV